MRNAGLEETQAGTKIAGRNLNNLRYADDTTLMAESEHGGPDDRVEAHDLLADDVHVRRPVFVDVICISEVIDISPSNLDSSLCFFQSSVSHDVLCIEVK